MKTYKCFKIVSAGKIISIKEIPDSDTYLIIVESGQDGINNQFVVDRSWIQKHDPYHGGYFVRYPDGYQSFSPVEAFESGYVEMDDAA